MPFGRTPRSVLCAGTLGVALAAGAAPAFAQAPALAAPGEAGPVVSDAATTPAAVTVSTAATQVAVATRVADPDGVESVTLRLSGGASHELSRTEGSAVEGTWTGVLPLAAGLDHGALTAEILAVDATGASSRTSVAELLEVLDSVPGAPVDVTATVDVTDAGALFVTWGAPQSNGGSRVDGYVVSARPAAAGPSGAVVPPVGTVDAAARETSIRGLSAGTRYVVEVAARNGVGTGPGVVADASTALGALTVPDAPGALVATPLPSAVHVAWEPPAADGGTPVTAYSVVAVPSGQAPTPAAKTLPADATGTTVGPLLNGTTYEIRVTARNAQGTSLPATVVATPHAVPSAPVVGAPVAGDGAAVVRWSPPASDNGSPVLSYSVTASPSGAVVTAPAHARSVVVSGLPNGRASTFRVSALNAAGSGPASVESAAAVPRQRARLLVTAQPGARVRHGRPVTVAASILGADGAALPDRVVVLLAKVVPSSAWRTVAIARSDAAGRVRLRAVLPATSALKLHHPPSTVAALDQPVRSVTVAKRLNASPSSTSVALGRSLTVRGGVAPAHGVGSVVYLQRHTSRGWTTIARGKQTASTAYAVTWRPPRPGVYYLRVAKPSHRDHAGGVSQTWRQVVRVEGAAALARQILANPRITLAQEHVAGVRDLAHPRQNVVDVAAGRPAHRSAYQNAPGGRTRIDIRVLRTIRDLGRTGSITVSEIAGGSHARRSSHFAGRGLDISWVNGRHVAPGSGYGRVVSACRAHGASAVYHPAYDPFGGHQGHVHCQWS